MNYIPPQTAEERLKLLAQNMENAYRRGWQDCEERGGSAHGEDAGVAAYVKELKDLGVSIDGVVRGPA